MEAKHGCDDDWATSSKDDEATSKGGDKRGDPSDAEICARVAAFLFEAHGAAVGAPRAVAEPERSAQVPREPQHERREGAVVVVRVVHQLGDELARLTQVDA